MENHNKDYCKDCHINLGIHCDAKHCVFNNGECNCTAEKISVGPSDATTSSETVCSTFQQKEF